MTFQLVRCTPCVMLMVLAWPESGFEEGAAPPAAAGHDNGLGAHEYQECGRTGTGIPRPDG